MSGPILYGELASWWPLVSAPADYAEEAAFYARLMRERSSVEPRSLLELGSGGGNNACHLERVFEAVTLLDLSPAMLEVSRALNPRCEHLEGDMRRVRLGRTFDCVFVHDAICYATTLQDLGAVLETAFVHCRPGGVAVIAPDFVMETFEPSTGHGGHDGVGRGLRYLEWSWDPDPTDRTYVVDFAFLLREGETTAVRHDRHVQGLFTRSEWMGAMRATGFHAECVSHRHSDVSRNSLVFVAKAPF